MICQTANLQCKRMCYIRWMLHLNCYTRGGWCMCRVITKQLMYGSSCNIGFCPHLLPVKLIKIEHKAEQSHTLPNTCLMHIPLSVWSLRLPAEFLPPPQILYDILLLAVFLCPRAKNNF